MAPWIRPGDVLAGRYRIEHMLGAGGMGVVFAAHDRTNDRAVAIKVLLAGAAGAPNARARFLREAQASEVIDNAHAIRVIDTGAVEDGPFLVMDRLKGYDLSLVLELRSALPIEQAAIAIRQACRGIGAAHAHGIVHRDIKPSNLFVAKSDDGAERIVVLDFGISKLAAPDGISDLTATTEVIGSPRYMSPEQVRSSKNVDVRSDIWSLGVVAYEAFTGARPFNADSMGALAAVILERAPVPIRSLRPEVPAEIEAAIERCLAKDPAGRFGRIEELEAALAPFAGDDRLSLLEGLSEAELDGRKTRRIVPQVRAPSGERTPREELEDASTHLDAGVTPAPRPRRAATYFAVGLIAALALGVMVTLRLLRADARMPAPASSQAGGVCVERGRQILPSARVPLRVALTSGSNGAVLSHWIKVDGRMDAMLTPVDLALSSEPRSTPFRLADAAQPDETRALVGTFRGEPIAIGAVRQPIGRPGSNAAESTLLALTPLDPPAGPFAPRAVRRLSQIVEDFTFIATPDRVLAVTLGYPAGKPEAPREVLVSSLVGGSFERPLFAESAADGGAERPLKVSAAGGAMRSLIVVRSEHRAQGVVVSDKNELSAPFEISRQSDSLIAASRGDELFVVWLDEHKRVVARRMAPERTELDDVVALVSGADGFAFAAFGDRLLLAWREAAGARRVHYSWTRGALAELSQSRGTLALDGVPIGVAPATDGMFIAFRALSIGVASVVCK